jgi:hypothetical protein
VADNLTPGGFFPGIRYSKESLFRSNDGGAMWLNDANIEAAPGVFLE